MVAGERSGDLHGGNLMHCIKEYDAEAQFRGFGGDAMLKEGLDMVTHHRDMDIIGLLDVIVHLGVIYQKINYCKQDIRTYCPDAVILIDFAGFNMRIANFCKKHSINVFYYISPKVWAWRRARALKLKATVDRMFCVLPFEKTFYKKYDWEVEYVGNPVLDAIKCFKPDTDFLHKNNLAKAERIIALLPGSRKRELKYSIPLLVKIAIMYPHEQFVVASVSSMPSEHYSPFSSCPNVRIVTDATYDLLVHAHAALVTSGTATLETALLNVPQATFYRTGFVEYTIVSSLLKVRYFSLVNLIDDTSVIAEYLQRQATVVNLSAELNRLMGNQEHRKKIMEGYARIHKNLDIGSSSKITAQKIVDALCM